MISLKTPSRFYVVGEEETVLPSLAFTASSLIVGWWGLPHGPIYTIQAVSSNLRGGERRRVGDLIDELRGHDRVVVRLTERTAENARDHFGARISAWHGITGRSHGKARHPALQRLL